MLPALVVIGTPDSGATHHVTPSGQNIQHSQTFEGPEQVFVGNGQGSPITSHGSTWFNSSFDSSFPLVISHAPLPYNSGIRPF